MGGRTILCDGWKVASALKANHPELYFLLSSVPIPRSFCKHQHSVHRTLKMNMKCNFWDNSEYIHRGGKRSTHYSTTDTILKVCDNADLINTSCFQHCPLTKELVQIRYNSYDRAPMDRCQKPEQSTSPKILFSVAPELLGQFYTALAALEEKLGDPRNQV